MGALGAGLAATALPASATATSNTYTIGSLTGSVSNVTISPTATTALSAESEELFFTATAALTTANTITVTSNNTLTALPTAVQVIDSSGPCLENASAAGLVTYTPTLTFTITLGASCTIAVGNTVQIDFTYDPTVTGTTTFTVATTNNGSASSVADLTVNSTPPTLSASSLTTGYNAMYTITGIGASGATGGSWATLTNTATNAWIVLSTSALTATAAGFAFYNGEAGYTVTVTPSGGSATSDALTGFNYTSTTSVDLELTTDIGSGSTVQVTAEGTNGNTATTTQALQVTKENGTPAQAVANTLTAAGNTEITNAVTFGSTVTAVLVTPSPVLASASSNYLVSFTAGTTGTPADICFSEANGGTSFINVSGALVTDTTGGWQYVPAVFLHAAPPNAGCSGNYGLVLVLAGQTMKAGDAVTVLLAGVTNPAAKTVSDFTVATSQDQLAATAAPYAITVSESAGITVTASPATVGSLSTYTISNIVVGSAGVLAGQAITIATTTQPNADTVFPNNVLDYVITDTTTTSGSGTVTAPSPPTGGGSNLVTIDAPNALKAGDIISITVNDVINPTTSGSYAITLTNANLGTPSVVAPAFPNATVTYPDGGIVDFGGTFYLFAGGHAFGIPTLAVLTSLQVIDHATTLFAATGATPPVTTPLLGTEIIVYNNPTIYVYGASGLNGFATPTQFLGDGYDPADVITVPNFGGLAVGATVGSVGTGDNVIGTAANGALIDSSGTFYVVAGGRACGIATLAQLASVQAGDQATPLVGAVPSSWTTSTMENGTLVTVNSAVFEADGGDLFALKAPSQLAADGLGGTPSLVLSNYCGMPVVTNYTGS